MTETYITSTKRLKPLDPSLGYTIKGKEKMFVETEEDLMEEDAGRICGICLSEKGKGMIRGEIDSCDHYFCFVCIMEWSKVESRCPMCKQRFLSIRREYVPGILQERIIRVPVRNQDSTAFSDPYAEVTCSCCQRSSDENLLLLCDLCDSAAHTYCVGLGLTVPDGDWFCPDCTISLSEHSKVENEDPLGNLDSQKSCNDPPINRSSITITDIVADEAFCGASHFSSDVCKTNIRPYKDVDNIPKESGVQNKSQILLKLSCPPRIPNKYSSTSSCTRISDQGARTLGHCRDVQGHIHRLRENWDKLRNGSMSFKMDPFEFGKIENKWKRHTLKSRTSRSGKVAPNNLRQQTVVNSVLTDISCGTNSNDVEKAWKMLDAVKSIWKTCGCNGSKSPVSIEKFSIKTSEKRDSTNVRTSSGVQSVHQLSCQGNRRKHRNDSAINKKSPEQKGPIHINSLEKSTICHHHNIGPPTHCAGFSHGWNDEISHKLLNKELFILDVQHKTLSTTTPMPGNLSSDILSFKDEQHLKKLDSKEKISKQRQAVDKYRDGSSSRDTCAKSEVQSLVKLNMKLQLINQQMELDRFKKVARVATHTILAACGLEHSKSNARPFCSVICQHLHNNEHFQRSHLMPTSCRQCFFSFVKDVVSSTMSDKVAAGTP